MKIALAQINTLIADFEGTVRKVGEYVQKAKAQKADLIAFPELALTGYPPRDLVEVAGFVERNLKALEEVARLASGIQIVVGYVDRNPVPGGKPLFNAAALCRDGKVAARYFKNLLPTYDVFDEGRYFQPGTEAGLWKDVGISICEDCWNDKLFWEKRLYPRDPIEEQVGKGAKFLLNISASPYTLGKPEFRRNMLSAIAIKHGVPIFYVNLAGANDELVFDGRSLVVNAKGEIVAEAKAYDEDLLVVDTEHLKPAASVPAINDLETVYRTLVTGVRDYVRKCGFEKVVLGLSGGIDSALTAVLAAEALGPQNVVGVAMPSPYSSEASLKDARLLAKNLGIRIEEYPIAGVYDAYRGLFGKKSGEAPDLADENIQARIRGNILMALSNRHRYLVLSTGNKSEIAVGYCTLYGDMSGGLAVIADVPKTMVYEVARYAQSLKAVIPEAIFTKPPSAELKPNQTDQDTLPPYDVLDGILKAAIEDNLTEDEIVALGFEAALVAKVMRWIKQNEYKRRQAAPGIKVTSKAFGIGRRYPIARKI
ncbi:MAG TPA: NAD+ synthase [bacterium]|nr:NAD+ synthase [bacterium]